MRTIRIYRPIYWEHKSALASGKAGIFGELFFGRIDNVFSKATWVYIRLVVQGVLFVPLLALITTYYHADFSIAAVICLVFLTNVIAGFDRPERALSSIVALCIIDMFMLLIFFILLFV